MTSLAPAEMKAIRALALDVDGVLTDGGVYWGPEEQEWKRFHFADIMGLSLARRAGWKLALISGEASPQVDRLARKARIDFVAKGCRDKAAALGDFAARFHLAANEICYMGDDVNDLPALRLAGLSAAPANAAPCVLAAVQLALQRPGGSGAVRELVERLFTAQGLAIEEIFARP